MRKLFLGLLAVGFLAFSCGLSLALDCNFVGSKGSDTYHTPDCGIIKNIKADNKTCFANQEDARGAGYKPCAVCKPDVNIMVVASRDSDKYHLPTCGIARNIKLENRIEFKTPVDAVEAGYKPCAVCKPPNPKVEKAKAPKASEKKTKK